MKTKEEWDKELLALYWNCEHGEHNKTIEKLQAWEKAAWTDGYREARKEESIYIEDNE